MPSIVEVSQEKQLHRSEGAVLVISAAPESESVEGAEGIKAPPKLKRIVSRRFRSFHAGREKVNRNEEARAVVASSFNRVDPPVEDKWISGQTRYLGLARSGLGVSLQSSRALGEGSLGRLLLPGQRWPFASVEGFSERSVQE